MSKKKLRPVYMTDEAYKNAQDKADKLGVSFSSYMGMLAKKESSEFYGDPTPSRPVGLMHHVDSKKALTENIAKWSLGKELNLSDDKIKLIVNKILEEKK